MNTGRHLISAAVAVALAGCGGGNDSVSSLDGAVAAKTGTVNLAVAFPEAAAGKALISSDAQFVGFRYCKVPQGENWCDTFGTGAGEVAVTRDNPTATVTLSPGLYMFDAGLFASSTPDFNFLIDHASTGGEIVEGANSVVMTFLRGDWTFETSTGAADALTLGDGTVLNGFKLYTGYDDTTTTPMAAAGKAAFNSAVPVGGWAEYGVALKTSAGELNAGWLEVMSQFHSGNDNNTTLDGFHWNLTKGCDDYDCGADSGDWFVSMIGADAGYDMYDSVYGLLPGDTLTDGSGNPVATDSYDSKPTDGVTIVTDIVEYQLGAKTETFVDTTATAAKAVAGGMPRSRGAAIRAAAAAADTASKSAATTNLGTLTATWYEPVIAASGDGTNRGTWNFDDYVYNPTTSQWEWVADACLVTGGTTVYATCGYLETVWDATTQTNIRDAGEFSWGFNPTDTANLGEYCEWVYDPVTYTSGCNPEPTAPFEPWNFEDLNSDGVIDYGSFQFSHYLQVEESMSNARIHNVTAKGAEFPVTSGDVTVQ